MANKYGGRRPIDSMSGVAPPARIRPRDSFHEPVPSSARRPAPKPVAAEKTPKVVSIELKIPKIKGLKLPSVPKFPNGVKQIKLSRLSRRYALSAAILGVVLLGSALFIGLNHKKEGAVSSTVTELKPATPSFDTVLPQTPDNNKPATGFDPDKSVASYADKIADVNITVSQQPLPASFKQNPDEEVQKLATNLKATKLIEAPGIKAYTGTSSQDGTQTVIFAKKDLLIFIRAAKPLTKDQIVQYIATLS